MIKALQREIRKHKNVEDADNLAWFFKTGPGEYGEGDKFLGIRVPIIRKIIKPYRNIKVDSLKVIMQSAYHEERMAALIILVEKYKKAKQHQEKKTIYDFYCANMQYINNWDLVDISAPHIVGNYLFENGQSILYKWAKNKNMWKRRISMLATFYFIRNNHFQDALQIAELLLDDNEDLIHKAVGWMLREIGKRDLKTEEAFLQKHYQKMPRTMLRYAIEKFPEAKRKKYLRK